MTPRKIPTDDPSILLTTQLYTSVYFILSRTLHMPYIPLYFTKPIMIQLHAPIHYPHKLLEYNIDV